MTQLIPDAALEPTISVDRAAAILGIHKRTLYLAIERGDFRPVMRVGRRVRIPTARFLTEFPDLVPTTGRSEVA
jgi:excisionase family DNA binding protein